MTAPYSVMLWTTRELLWTTPSRLWDRPNLCFDLQERLDDLARTSERCTVNAVESMMAAAYHRRHAVLYGGDPTTVKRWMARPLASASNVSGAPEVCRTPVVKEEPEDVMIVEDDGRVTAIRAYSSAAGSPVIQSSRVPCFHRYTSRNFRPNGVGAHHQTERVCGGGIGPFGVYHGSRRDFDCTSHRITGASNDSFISTVGNGDDWRGCDDDTGFRCGTAGRAVALTDTSGAPWSGGPRIV